MRKVRGGTLSRLDHNFIAPVNRQLWPLALLPLSRNRRARGWAPRRCNKKGIGVGEIFFSPQNNSCERGTCGTRRGPRTSTREIEEELEISTGGWVFEQFGRGVEGGESRRTEDASDDENSDRRGELVCVWLAVRLGAVSHRAQVAGP